MKSKELNAPERCCVRWSRRRRLADAKELAKMLKSLAGCFLLHPHCGLVRQNEQAEVRQNGFSSFL